MVPITYLIACICSILSYDIARSLTTFETPIAFLQNSQLPIKVVQMFWYCDIIILILAILSSPFLKKKYEINIFNPAVYIKNKKIVLFLLIPILASNCKSWISSSISGDVIMTYSLFTPFLAFLFGRIILKENISKNYKLALLIAFCGFTLTKYKSLHLGFHWGLFCYVIINAMSVIAVRYISIKRRNIEGIVFENMIYAIQGVILFAIFGGFSWRMLFSWQVLLVAIPSIIHHIFIITGNQKAKHTGSILLADFIKVGISVMSCFCFFRRFPNVYEAMGILIILFSLTILRQQSKK